ncbi:MAG: sugar phosphate nucleotidyltransferase [Candidatus Lokiarchaeia archaeon]
MEAVILAAGIGKRLKPLTSELPKAFIPIGDSLLLYYSLNNIRSIGITDVFIVVGFMENYFKKKLGNKYDDINITYISNKQYSTTGSMYSLSQTKGYLDEDILLLESDLLYEKRALTELINYTYPNVILTSSIRQSGDEVFIHMDDDNCLTNLGKNIDKTGANSELVGISKLSLDFLNELYKKAEEDYVNGEKNYHYEEVIYKLSKSYPVKCLFIEDLLWTEIDTHEDLEKARKNIYPRIRDKQM